MMERPPTSTYFLNILPFYQNLRPAVPSPIGFGFLGNVLPAFIHILGFILISASIIRFKKKRDIPLICILWLLVAWAFEVGQNFPYTINQYIPAWFEKFPFLENVGPYFHSGTFDIFDLVAAAAGAAAACMILLTSRKTEFKEGQ